MPPSLTRLLLAVLLLLPVSYGGMGHAQAQSVIDVAVFYTTAARTAQGGTERMQAKIDELVAMTNMAYEDSDVDQRINLVHVEEVQYPETATIGTDLRRLRDLSDGHLDHVHGIRDRVRADIVMLLRAQGTGNVTGIAYQMPKGVTSASFARHAFGVSVVNAVVFAHELGHIMGLRHDRYDACGHDTDNPECPDNVVKPYAYGYVNQAAFESGAASAKRWRTIMALNNQCVDADFNCDHLLYFSNPDNCYPDDCPPDGTGDPMGVSGTQDTTDVDGPADAARTLDDTRATVAELREGRAVQVSFAAESYTVTEGGTVTVTVQLDAAPGRTLDLPIPLTATSTTGAWSGDYSIPASITFGSNQTERTFTFTATQDTREEDTETVTLGFGTPRPAGVRVGSQATATVTLTDDTDDESAAPSVSAVVLSSDPGAGYAAGAEITVAVVFTKPISVTGTPSIELTVGTTTRTAQCQDVASEVLTCTYTVMADESDTDGVSIAAGDLALNGGTIRDKESTPQNAALAHPAVAAASAHTVDGDTPDLVTATVDADTMTLTYDETLDTTSLPAANAFTVTAGSATPAVNSVELSGAVVTLTLSAQVVHGDSVTLAYAPPAGTPPLRDMVGNPADTLSSQTVTNNTSTAVYDTDNDGLIAITTPAQLDAIRHDLDGDGNPTPAGAAVYAAAFSAVTRVVCGVTSGGCDGYELMADLDFLDTNEDGQVDADDDTNGDGQVDAEDTPYWNHGSGWDPIRAARGVQLFFDTTFEGNGHTIRHLFISQSSSSVGLFGYLPSDGVIRNVGLTDVEVTGRDSVGGLVGQNDGTIRGSYATGWVEGAGRLSDFVGGLVGLNRGTITASYATARVSGNNDVGGLAGAGSGTITASYATGRVSGRADVGGLVGQSSGTITASYATGRVSGSSNVGGLVGASSSATVTNSYWDTDTSGQASSAGGTAKTTEELQTPTGYTTGSIYADWNVDLDGNNTNDDPWHFGTSSQYPVLKVDFDQSGTATWQEFGYQLRAGPTSLTVTTSMGLVGVSWTAVSIGSTWDPAPDVTYTVTRTTGSTVETVAEDLTASPYTDRTVTRGTMYTYQVAAVVNGGEATRSGRSTEVTATNQPAAFPSTEDGMRTIAENTPANRNIGAPVAATDPDDTTLTYSLSGTDAADFSLNTSTGQLQTKAALNRETKDTYEVTVTVKDGKDVNNATDDMDADATIDVTITVTDVPEKPEVSGPTSVTDYAENSTSDVATYTAMDPENQTIRWTVSDTTNFAISTTGVLTFRSSPDFERRNSYTVRVTATDPGGLSDSVTVTISIVNVNEDGMVTLTGSPPQVGRLLTAMLSDSDGGVSSITWQWERSADQSNWTAFTTGVSSSGARSSYQPVAGDLNQYLRITAAYTDRSGPNQSAWAAPTTAVQAAPVVTLILTPATITEQDDTTTPGTNEVQTVVTAMLDKASSAATTVTVRVTAGAGAVTQSGSRLTIAKGTTASAGTVRLTAKNNNVYEPTGRADITVGGTATNPDGIMGPAAVTLEITDDDERPAVTALRLSTNEINEKGSGNSATVTATLSHPSSAETTVDVAAVATGPTGAGNFTLSATPTLTFPANTTASTGTVTITADDDEVDAPNQTVRVTLAAPDGITIPTTLGSQLLTIKDDEATPTLTLVLTPASISEDGGVSDVTATLSHASSVDIEVTVSAEPTAPATAADFTLSGSTLTFTAGQTTSSGTVTLTAEDNDLDAPDKTVTVTGAVASYGLGTIASATQKLTIEDDDTPEVTLTLTPSSINENGGVSTVTARLSPVSSQATVVTVSAAAVSPAVAGDFRLSANKRLTIRANQSASEGTVTLTAVNNDVDGPTTKKVTVSGTTTRQGVTIPDSVTLEITDDDTRGVTVSETTLSIREHDAGETPARGTYTVKLDSEPTATVTIAVASSDAAVSVERPSPPRLTFTRSNWKTAQTVTLTTTPDADANNETATITHTVTGGDYEANGVGAASVAVTVTDDESPSTTVTLRVNPATVTEGTSRTVTVTGGLDGAPEDDDITVTVTVAAETATSGADFETVSSFPLTITAGETSGTATFTLPTQDDNIYESAETVTVSGTTTAGLTVTETTLTITDNDNPPTLARLELAATRIDEAGETTTVTAHLSHPSSTATVVELTVPVGAAAVTLNQAELTIPAGDESGEVTVSGVSDDDYTSHRAVTLRGRVTDPPSTVRRDVRLTVLDDDGPEVTGETAPTVTEGKTAVAEYTAPDPAGVGLVWTVSDASTFAIDANGRLRFRNAPDHETQASYSVTVRAADESLPEATPTGELVVTVTVEDALGTVRLSSQQTQVGSRLTATLSDRVDGVEEVTEWCWARSFLSTFPDTPEHPTTELSCTTSALTTTATYTPVDADLNHYLRATATYSDGDGTSKMVEGDTTGTVSDRPVRRPPGGGVPPGGGGGGGGGGGPACAEDVHGNSAAQATAIALDTETTGAICPAADVDYLTVTALGSGLLFVDTFGGVPLRGSIWQHDAPLASGPTSDNQPGDRLGARVQAGTVVVALQGQGEVTGPYEVEMTFTSGALENPGPASFQSGVGVLSGWVCAAGLVEMAIADLPVQVAGYGTERLDTAGVCGDSDNGFGLLFNWNRLADGEHMVTALVDGVELAQATVTVKTLGTEFLRGAEGECVVEDFPLAGQSVLLEWQQNSQNFVMTGGSAPGGENPGSPAAVRGALENPGPNSFQSGVGVLSGWVCEADTVEIAIGDFAPQLAAYGTERLDTESVCGDSDNGFGLLFNWNRLGDGEHDVVAFVDGVELGRATVRVTTLGVEFLRGVEGECTVEDFPMPGETVTLEWQQNQQNFVIVGIE